jgi:hypothetical protein
MDKGYNIARVVDNFSFARTRYADKLLKPAHYEV